MKAVFACPSLTPVAPCRYTPLLKRFTSALEKVSGSSALAHLRGLGSVKGAGTAAPVADCHFNLRCFCSLEAVRDFDREHFDGHDARAGVFLPNIKLALGVDAPLGDPRRSSYKGLREDATDVRSLSHPNAGYHGPHKSYFAMLDCNFPGEDCPDAHALGERCKAYFEPILPYMDAVSSARDVTGAAEVSLAAGMCAVESLVESCLPKMQRDLAAADVKFSTIVDASAKEVVALEAADDAAGVRGPAVGGARAVDGGGGGDGRDGGDGGDDGEGVVLGHHAVASAKLYKYLNQRYTMKHRVAVVLDFLKVHALRRDGDAPSRFAESVLAAPGAIRACLDSLRRPATKISQFNIRCLSTGESIAIARFLIDEHCGSAVAQACMDAVIKVILSFPSEFTDLLAFFSADGLQSNLIWHSGMHPSSSFACRALAEKSVAALRKDVPRRDQEALLQAAVFASSLHLQPFQSQPLNLVLSPMSLRPDSTSPYCA